MGEASKKTAHPGRKQLAAFLWGQLGEAEQSAIAAHVQSCDACCQVLREIPDDAFLARLRDVNTPAGSSTDKIAAIPPHERPLPPELAEHPRYAVGRFLGAGGMGLVYQAEHRLMGRPVAIKVIHRELIRHPRVVERFHQEVKAAARLSHPNIVTAFDADQAGDAHFLVMEFVDGISLARLVARKGPLDVALAVNFIRQAVKGLQHAFEAGMVHRDIKPHNLMLTRKGQVKILDFGLARLASESRADLEAEAVDQPLIPPPGDDAGASDDEEQRGLTRHGDVIGTPDFMAPEQILNSSQADIRADIFSVGCTLFYLLTGKAPFVKEPLAALVASKKKRTPQPITELRSDLPADLIAVLNKMLARDPAQRYQTPAELGKALAAIGKAPAPPTSAKAAAPPPQMPTTDSSGRIDAAGFMAQCPFCTSQSRVPAKALGKSIPCAQCGSYFTVVPADDGSRKS
jgi:serine/threonine protein kinase